MSRLYTPDFICNHKHFGYWRHQQRLNCELSEKSAVLFGLWLHSAYPSLVGLDDLDSKTMYT